MPANARAGSQARRYDIEADWILVSRCGFRCSYCFWEESALRIPPTVNRSPDQVKADFDATGLTWLLHITGGEPLGYPSFVDLCAALTESHLISLNTNADAERVATEFASRIRPDRVDFVHVGVHPEQRSIGTRFWRLVRNVTVLRDAGFFVFASCVMEPRVFKDVQRTWDHYAEHGVVLIPKALQGSLRGGKVYPGAYTPAEREAFLEMAACAAEHYEGMFARRPEPPSVNPLLDPRLLLGGLPDHRGKLCDAGYRFVRIREDGEIRRCGPADVLGNLHSRTFVRTTGAAPCRDLECPYFCEKYLVRDV